jgi:hypothetical protein
MRWVELDSRDIARVARAHYPTEARKLRGFSRQARLRYLQASIKTKEFNLT